MYFKYAFPLLPNESLTVVKNPPANARDVRDHGHLQGGDISFISLFTKNMMHSISQDKFLELT